VLKNSFRLFTIGGIEVGVHYSWLIVFALVTWSLSTLELPREPELRALPALELWLLGAITSLLLFASVLVHELAHSFVARARGLQATSITLFIFGGVSNLAGDAKSATTEFLMGQRGMQIGQAAVTVLPQFERAEAILAGLDDDDAHGRLLRFWNLTWLGWIGVLSGRPRGVVMPQLEAAAAIAEARGAPELQAEAARVQALALNHLGDRAAAGRMMDEGLAIARAARSPDTTARILCDRADLRRQAVGDLGEGERARRSTRRQATSAAPAASTPSSRTGAPGERARVARSRRPRPGIRTPPGCARQAVGLRPADLRLTRWAWPTGRRRSAADPR
jgi:hypothetical protein